MSVMRGKYIAMLQSQSDIIPFNLQVRTHQIFSGLAAGNLGDDLMMLGFLKLIQPGYGSTVEVWDENSPAIRWLPETCRYISCLDDDKCERYASDSQAVLLVGGTPVSELLGLNFPMRALKNRLLFCHHAGIPVHAVGVGVDQLKSPDARNIFRDAFLPITSWTVRSAACHRALIESGVPDERIGIAADLAWLYEPYTDCSAWASSQWKLLGVDVDRPLIGVNVVNEVWRNNPKLYKNIALALDCIAEKHHAQIAFMCNEVREGEYFDHAAAMSVMDLMKAPSVCMSNHYYHPDEMIGLLSQVDVSLSQRYHFTIESVMAGTVPVSFARGQKLAALIEDLGMSPVGSMDSVEPDDICRGVTEALERGDYWRNHLSQARKHLQLRAMNNGCYIKQVSAGNVQNRSVPVAITDIVVPSAQLASVRELESVGFQAFMSVLNGLAHQWGFRVSVNCSKVWEYPWIWFHVLYRINWQGKHLVDLGSEISPMPWLIALLGARVTLVEIDTQWLPVWEKLKNRLQVDIQWYIVNNEILPLPDDSVDVVTSFSVIGHQPDKITAVNEIDRILKPGGILGISCNICDPDRGIERNGQAMTMQELETIIWHHPAFGNQEKPDWNVEETPAFLSWLKQSAPHHLYVVGAAVLQKQSGGKFCTARFISGWFDEEFDVSGFWRWSDSRGTIELYCRKDLTVDIQFELCSVPEDNRISILLNGLEVKMMEIEWSGFKKISPFSVPLQRGVHILTFCSQNTPTVVPSDTRNLAFSIKNFTI